MSGERMGSRISIAVVGLGFGENFVPIYLSHPDVDRVGIVDQNADRLAEVAGRYGLEDTFTSLDALLAAHDFDAVHIATPVMFHGEHAIAVLSSGRHCACAVPMATTIADLEAIIAAQAESGTNYMMMETSVYTREFFYTEELCRSGKLGTISFYSGFHMQDLDGYPSYWTGFPPMHYSTHALSPILAITRSEIENVYCAGSGALSPERRGSYANPYPLETGIFQLAGSPLAVEITMSFSHVARSYVEGFSLYGDAVGVEWPQHQETGLQVTYLRPLTHGARGRHGGRLTEVVATPAPDRPDLLPDDIGRFTQRTHFQRPGASPIAVGSGHGGSHPHLVHEFVRSIVEGRPSAVDELTAASWTAPGIIAHESAMHGGVKTAVPRFGVRAGLENARSNPENGRASR